MQQFVSPRNHVAKRAQVLFLEHSLDGSEDPGNFLAALHDFVIAESFCVLRTADAAHWKLATRKAANVLSVLLRPDQLVVATPHEVKEVIEELADICGAYEILEMQFADALAQVDPQIFVIEHAEFLTATFKEQVAVGVKGSGLQTRDVGTCEFRLHAVPHLFGSILGVSEGEDLIGTRVALPNQACDATSKDGGFAGSRARQHQHGAAEVLDCLPLALVGSELARLQRVFGGRHWEEQIREG